MTTIVAVERNDKVTFAADSRVSGYQINDNWVSKIAQNGPYTLAAAGYLRAIQILQYAKLPDPPKTEDPAMIDRFVTQEVVPAIKDAFKDDSDTKDNTMLLAVSGRVYQVWTDSGSWVRNADGNYSIGSGSDIALGALAAGAKPAEAVAIAARYDSGTGGEVVTMKVKK